MTINTGINIGIDGTGAVTGARVVNRSLDEVKRTSRDTVSNVDRLKSSLGGFTTQALRTAAAIIGITSAVYGLRAAFSFAFKSVDDFKTNVASMSAVVLTFMDKTKYTSIGEAWKVANDYAKELIPTLELISAKMLMSGQQATLMFTELAKAGIFLDASNKKAVEGFQALGNAILILTKGQDPERQIMTEIRAVMTGQAQPGSMLMRMLTSIDSEIESHLKVWIQSGDALNKMGELLSGFVPASKELERLWLAVKSTISTLATQVLRGVLMPEYMNMMTYLMGMRDFIIQHKEEIQGDVLNAWLKVKYVVGTTYDIISAIVRVTIQFKDELMAISATIATVKLISFVSMSSSVTRLIWTLKNLRFVLVFYSATLLPALITPIGLVAAAIGILTLAFITFETEAERAEKRLNSFNESLITMDATTAVKELKKVNADFDQLQEEMWAAQSKDVSGVIPRYFHEGYIEDLEARMEQLLVMKDKLQEIISPDTSGNVPPDPMKFPPIDDKMTRTRLQMLMTLMKNELALIKQYNDMAKNLFEHQYNYGVITLRDYTEKRIQLIESGAVAEVAVIEQQVKDTLALKSKIVDSPTSDKQKLEMDVKVAQLRGKIDITNLKSLEAINKVTRESIGLTQKQVSAYADLRAEALNLKGLEEESIKVRIQNELQGTEYSQLLTEAINGTEGAVEALTDKLFILTNAVTKYRLEILKANIAAIAMVRESSGTAQKAQITMEVDAGKLSQYEANEKLIEIEKRLIDSRIRQTQILLDLSKTDKEKIQYDAELIVLSHEKILAEKEYSRALLISNGTLMDGMREGVDQINTLTSAFETGKGKILNIYDEIGDGLVTLVDDTIAGEIDSIDEFFQSLAESITDAFRKAIAEIIAEFLKMQIIKPMMSGLMGGAGFVGGLLGGGGGGAADVGGTSESFSVNYDMSYHKGGLVIGETSSIPRFHSGGLRSDERMSINKVGERYITSEHNEWLTNMSKSIGKMSQPRGDINMNMSFKSSGDQAAADKLANKIRRVVQDEVRSMS